MSVPFSIRCVSCHGRLRVTEEALVGTIVACPRCGSMVQILAPENESETLAAPQPPMVVGNEQVDSQDLTRSELLSDEDLPHTPPPGQGNGTFAVAAPPVEASIDDHSVADSTAPPAEAGSETDWQDSANWSSETTRRFRRKLVVGVAGVAGLLVAGVLLIWSLRDSDETGYVADSSKTSVELDPPVFEDNRPTELPTDNSTPPTELNIDRPATNEESNANGDDSQLAGNPDVTSTGPETDNSMIPADLLPSDVLGNSSVANSTNTTDKDGGPVVPTQPDEDVAEPLLEMPAGLEVFTQLLGLPGDAPDAPLTQAMPAAAEDVIIDQAADAMIDPMLLATPAPEINIDNALKLKVALQTKGYPLGSLILVCSELTQVPIQIDWVTLDLAGVSISQTIHDRQPGWKTIGEVLDMISAQAGVVIEHQPTKLFVSLSEADTLKRLQPVHATSDFGDEEASAKSLVDLIVGQAPWSERELAGLRALATDNLRVARGIPTKLSEQTLTHWSARANCLQAGATGEAIKNEGFPECWPLLVGGESGSQLDTSITLAGILRQTSRLNQAECVVNWDDVLLRRLTPGQLVLPFAKQPAGQMLASTLAPMALQTRVADDGHWWVGTAATYDRMPVFVVGDECGPRRDEILARIGSVAAAADVPLLIEHDPVSDRYLSLMPRFIYRQLPTVLQEFVSPTKK